MDGYRICTRCVMDTTDPAIEFDETGQCNYCAKWLGKAKVYMEDSEDRDRCLNDLIKHINYAGRGHQYN